MSESDNVVASSASIDQAVDSIASTVTEMSSGLHSVSDTVAVGTTKTHHVREALTASSHHVNQLEEAAASVTGVVELIMSIAQQTNMLALNATIEAARAGELGKGFAVVAGEVKDLAGATAQATSGITEHIDQIRALSRDLIGSLGRLDTEVAALHSQQDDVAAAVRSQDACVSEIVTSVNEASQSLSGVTSEVGVLSRVVKETDDIAVASVFVARELHEIAADLTARI